MNSRRRPACRGSRMPHSAALALNALVRRLSRRPRSRHRGHVRNPGVGAAPQAHRPAARFSAFLRFQTSPAWRRHNASSPGPGIETIRNAPRLHPSGHWQPRSIGSSSGTGVAQGYRPGLRGIIRLAVWVCLAESGPLTLPAPPSLFAKAGDSAIANVRPRKTPNRPIVEIPRLGSPPIAVSARLPSRVAAQMSLQLTFRRSLAGPARPGTRQPPPQSFQIWRHAKFPHRAARHGPELSAASIGRRASAARGVGSMNDGAIPGRRGLDTGPGRKDGPYWPLRTAYVAVSAGAGQDRTRRIIHSARL